MAISCPGGERGGKKCAGVVLMEKRVCGRFFQGVGRMRGKGLGVAWGIEGKVIPAAFRNLWAILLRVLLSWTTPATALGMRG